MDGIMGRLKEYASVVTAAVSVIAALAVLGLWAINAQVTPEIKRVDGRMDNYETQYTELKDRLGRMDHRLERRLDRIDNRFIQIDERFVQMESRINQRFDDMAANINTILARLPAPADQVEQ